MVKLPSLAAEVAKELEDIQASLFRRASEALAKGTRDASTMDELKGALSEGGIVRIHWCGDVACEARLKESTGGKVLNVPLAQDSKGRCISCGREGTLANFAKSY